MKYSELTKEQKAQIRKDIKKANQRLRTIEKSGLEIFSYAYRWVQENKQSKIFKRTRNKEIKFNTSIATLNEEELSALVSRVDQFLSFETSTKIGINKYIKKRYEKFKERERGSKYAKMKEDEFANLLVTKIKELVNKYGSDQVYAVMESVPEANQDDILEWAEECLKGEYDYFEILDKLRQKVVFEEKNSDFDEDEFEAIFKRWEAEDKLK